MGLCARQRNRGESRGQDIDYISVGDGGAIRQSRVSRLGVGESEPFQGSGHRGCLWLSGSRPWVDWGRWIVAQSVRVQWMGCGFWIGWFAFKKRAQGVSCLPSAGTS